MALPGYRARSSAGPGGFVAAIAAAASLGVLLGALIGSGFSRARLPGRSSSLAALKLRHRESSAPTLSATHDSSTARKSGPASLADPGWNLTVRECLDTARAHAKKHASELAERLPGTGRWQGLARAYIEAYTLNINYFAFAAPYGRNATFIFTGTDIEAMWLRDSAAQFNAYIGMAQSSQCMRVVLEGIIRQQADLILQDAYANAFNPYPRFKERHLGRGGYVFTRNYELDSLAYFVRFAYMYWAQTGAEDVFDDRVHSAMRKIAVLWASEKDHTFSPYIYKELANEGRGPPTGVTGMTWNAFRPSDDRCEYSYHIPGNIMAAASLRQMAEIQTQIYHDKTSANFSNVLADEIEAGIRMHGIIDKGNMNVYAYEVDGMGNSIFMDDANVPSLLSIPYLLHKPQAGGHQPRSAVPFPSQTAFGDEVYARTRRLIMDPRHNPYFYKGSAVEGIGSPHIKIGKLPVWPMAIIMRGLTATDVTERQQALLWALQTTAGTGLQHESFDADNPNHFTRRFFGWPNALFSELVEQMLLNGDFNVTSPSSEGSASQH